MLIPEAKIKIHAVEEGLSELMVFLSAHQKVEIILLKKDTDIYLFISLSCHVLKLIIIAIKVSPRAGVTDMCL